jgi:histidinol-phosphate aminotransferase
MNTFDINKVIRQNILRLKPYSSARSEFEGVTSIMLDANENSMGSTLAVPHNRYPDPLQKELKQRISELKGVKSENIFIGNGSDEPIDQLIRATCDPGKNNIIICPPTYGMYEVAANINDVAIKEILLKENFQLDVNAVINSIDSDTKLIFLCSPNNPTGNALKEEDILAVLKAFSGIVILDEAYIDFAEKESFINRLSAFPNLVILQTFSKAWGLAGLRVGVAYASEAIIAVLNKIKAPYNISLLAQQAAMQALTNEKSVAEWVTVIRQQREWVIEALQAFPFIEKIYPSDANFLLIKTTDANSLYNYLLIQNIVVRNRTNVPLCDNCLRITIGTEQENQLLLNAFKKYNQ